MTLSSYSAVLKVSLLATSFAIAFVIIFGVPDALASNEKGNSPILILDSDTGWVDFNWDGLSDYYVKAHYTGKTNKVYKIDVKFIDECVDGSTHDDAVLKLGFTNKAFYYYDRHWISDGIEAWTTWFKSNKGSDRNNTIDLVVLPHGTSVTPFPSSGEDVIVKNQNEKNGSFSHRKNITQLDGQSGWAGSIYFKAPPGEYYIWTIHPAEGYGGCDGLAAVGIPIIINE